MRCRDSYGLSLTTSRAAGAAYDRGVGRLLRLEQGAADSVAASLAHDPTFALGHATLALLGREMCLPIDVEARLHDAEMLAPRATERERSHVHAVAAHLRGDPAPLRRHLAAHPRDAVLLAAAVPTIAFSGATEVPEEAWAIVEGAAPAYGNDPWFAGLLAFVRTEQRRFDEAMDLATTSLAAIPTAGHAAHARAHAHYETGDHAAGLAWMDEWVRTQGHGAEGRSHFVWHAALHELSLGDLDGVARRYDADLRPDPGLGCRALVDAGSLLVRWALTPGATGVPGLEEVVRATPPHQLHRPATPFLALHAAVVLLALEDTGGLAELAAWAHHHPHPTQREVVAPLAQALGLLAGGAAAAAAEALAGLAPLCRRLGGSDAQREVVEECRIAALLRAGRLTEARALLDARLDRRESPRDRRWRTWAATGTSAAA